MARAFPPHGTFKKAQEARDEREFMSRVQEGIKQRKQNRRNYDKMRHTEYVIERRLEKKQREKEIARQREKPLSLRIKEGKRARDDDERAALASIKIMRVKGARPFVPYVHGQPIKTKHGRNRAFASEKAARLAALAIITGD